MLFLRQAKKAQFVCNGRLASAKAVSGLFLRDVPTFNQPADSLGLLKDTEILPLKLKNVEVWSWRYEGDGNTTMLFNVTFDDATGKATDISRERDPKVHGGA